MATSLPYLASNKNIETLFQAILSAKVPEKFTQDFLQNTIGLKGTNDRQVIPFLRNLKFLDQSGSPTANYRLLKSKDTAALAIADGIRQAYAPLFAANENANSLAPERLRGLVAQVAGTDDDMTRRIHQTLAAVIKLGDFSSQAPSPKQEELGEEDVKDDETQAGRSSAKKMRPEFHYNLQIHLPGNATEEVYLNIFNAMRKTFQ